MHSILLQNILSQKLSYFTCSSIFTCCAWCVYFCNAWGCGQACKHKNAKFNWMSVTSNESCTLELAAISAELSYLLLLMNGRSLN